MAKNSVCRVSVSEEAEAESEARREAKYADALLALTCSMRWADALRTFASVT